MNRTARVITATAAGSVFTISGMVAVTAATAHHAAPAAPRGMSYDHRSMSYDAPLAMSNGHKMMSYDAKLIYTKGEGWTIRRSMSYD